MTLPPRREIVDHLRKASRPHRFEDRLSHAQRDQLEEIAAAAQELAREGVSVNISQLRTYIASALGVNLSQTTARRLLDMWKVHEQNTTAQSRPAKRSNRPGQLAKAARRGKAAQQPPGKAG